MNTPKNIGRKEIQNDMLTKTLYQLGFRCGQQSWLTKSGYSGYSGNRQVDIVAEDGGHVNKN